MPPSLQPSPEEMEFCAQKFSYFTISFIIELKESLLTKSTVVYIAMVSDKYETWGCFLSQTKGSVVYRTDVEEFLNVFIANGKHDFYHSTKKRQHNFDILKAFFVRHSSEYENVG